ncbi:ribulose-phosphate 3-epimerase [Lachnospiraceae bacterium NK3A20]|nr:ribulose-phosphate 3-epimerase [Lachnospiraceae bacterium NK3A20]
MQYKLSPSILSADFGCLADQIGETRKAGAPYVHIDVMDGLFVPSISYGMPLIKSIRKYTDQVFDVHLMIQDPIRYITDFADAGADIITFHLEAAKDPGAVIALIGGRHRKVGLAIKPGTPIEAARPFVNRIDQLLVMTVEPGFGGQKYIPASTKRIEQAKRMIEEECDPGAVDLQVDGGINQDTITTVLDAGANVIVTGSAVYHGDICANTQYYLNILKKREQQ